MVEWLVSLTEKGYVGDGILIFIAILSVVFLGSFVYFLICLGSVIFELSEKCIEKIKKI